MSGSQTDVLPLTTDVREHPAVFASAFNSGDPDLVERVYEEDGILVLDPAAPLTGAARREGNARFMSLGVPIAVSPRHVHQAGDIAFLIVDWEVRGTGPDGREVDIRGTATDVARRGADGLWRYVIDNPFGVAGAPAAP
ncbi:YybH family protein [Nocardiopsis changdeensis]|uniref:DUF4440 domain-containing protein n=1 Tax=Nocardiopsis changdeensis TaxID=2831969 RepID=A0ABX8BPU0_9ACTN|nr:MULTISPECIES: nuclear transport factor 2 family protein [Nocardiopsis]QUX24257.1 DUF4440 domain-containing protein [Nocardiopsis changdeensis]QYX34649.1 DUF4440 domain-containing protein [Nocardiopsis sp. MT53]